MHILQCLQRLCRRSLTWLNPSEPERYREPSFIQTANVTFIGGPFDGWTETIDADCVDRKQPQLFLPVSENMLRLARRESVYEATPITSVAFYVLKTKGSRYVYNFVGCGDRRLMEVQTIPFGDVDLMKRLHLN